MFKVVVFCIAEMGETDVEHIWTCVCFLLRYACNWRRVSQKTYFYDVFVTFVLTVGVNRSQ